MFDPSSNPIRILQTQSLTTVVQAEIERLILNGELKPGERLNENALAVKLGVSRGPIREACRALSQMGLVSLVPNRGVFIRLLSDEEVRDVYEVRAGIFAYAGMLLATRITDAQIETLRSMLDRMEQLAAEEDFDAYYRANMEFHSFLVEATNNERLFSLYTGLVRELSLFRARGLHQPGHMALSNAEHRAIVDALATRQPEIAHETMLRHVRSGFDRTMIAAAKMK